MKLVTFQTGKTVARAGALIDGGRRVLDLQAAHRLRYKKTSKHLASVLAMAQGGDTALELGNTLVKGAARAKSATHALKDVKLLASFLTLEEVVLPPDVSPEPLRALPNLKRLSYRSTLGKESTNIPAQTAAEFWAEYDAQQAAGKK